MVYQVNKPEEKMLFRCTIVAVAILSLVVACGCDSDDSTAPVVPDTDYDYVVMNSAGIDFVVFGQSSPSWEWELIGLHGREEEVSYVSEVGETYGLRFCHPDSGLSSYYRELSYSYNTNEDQYWVLD